MEVTDYQANRLGLGLGLGSGVRFNPLVVV